MISTFVLIKIQVLHPIWLILGRTSKITKTQPPMTHPTPEKKLPTHTPTLETF